MKDPSLSKDEIAQVSNTIDEAKLYLDSMKIEEAIVRGSKKQQVAFHLAEKLFEGMSEQEAVEFDTLYLAGGNQSGKSYAAACIWCKMIRDYARPGSIFWCVAPNEEKSIGTQQKYMSELLPKSKQATLWTQKNGFGSKNSMLIYDPNGRNITIKFKSQKQYDNDPDSFESETIDGLWIDESVSLNCYSAAVLRIAVRGGFCLYSSIPSADWMYDNLENAEEGAGVKMIHMLPKDNPAMTRAAYNRLKAKIKDPLEYAMRIEGKHMLLDKLIFPEFSRSKHIIPREDAPKKYDAILAGLDVGSDHPTVWIQAGLSEGKMYIIHEYCARHKTIEQDCESIMPLVQRNPLSMPTWVDPSAFKVVKGMGTPVGIQYIQAGLPVSPSLRTQAGVNGEYGIISRMKDAFRHNEIFILEDTAPKLVRELSIWSYKRDQQGRPLGAGNPFQDRNNDAIDALKYIFMNLGLYYNRYTNEQLEAFGI